MPLYSALFPLLCVSAFSRFVESLDVCWTGLVSLAGRFATLLRLPVAACRFMFRSLLSARTARSVEGLRAVLALLVRLSGFSSGAVWSGWLLVEFGFVLPVERLDRLDHMLVMSRCRRCSVLFVGWLFDCSCCCRCRSGPRYVGLVARFGLFVRHLALMCSRLIQVGASCKRVWLSFCRCLRAPVRFAVSVLIGGVFLWPVRSA